MRAATGALARARAAPHSVSQEGLVKYGGADRLLWDVMPANLAAFSESVAPRGSRALSYPRDFATGASVRTLVVMGDVGALTVPPSAAAEDTDMRPPPPPRAAVRARGFLDDDVAPRRVRPRAAAATETAAGRLHALFNAAAAGGARAGPTTP